MMTPSWAAKNARTSSKLLGPAVAGKTGTPAATAAARAADLLPTVSSTAASGPTNVCPAVAHARAKSAFSARKP